MCCQPSAQNKPCAGRIPPPCVNMTMLQLLVRASVLCSSADLFIRVARLLSGVGTNGVQLVAVCCCCCCCMCCVSTAVGFTPFCALYTCAVYLLQCRLNVKTTQTQGRRVWTCPRGAPSHMEQQEGTTRSPDCYFLKAFSLTVVCSCNDHNFCLIGGHFHEVLFQINFCANTHRPRIPSFTFRSSARSSERRHPSKLTPFVLHCERVGPATGLVGARGLGIVPLGRHPGSTARRRWDRPGGCGAEMRCLAKQ